MKADVVTRSFHNVATGELQGSATAVQMPDIECKYVLFVAASDNAGSVYIGGSGVTVPDGTTDTTSGFELAAGDALPLLPVANMNLLWRICDNAGDDLLYMIFM